MEQVKLHLGVAVSFLLALSSCSTTRQSFSPTECNDSAAYDRGYREGTSGLNPETEYAFQCREDLREAVRKGYRSGHEKGYVEYKERLAKWEAQQREMARGHVAESLPIAPQYNCEISWAGRGFQSEGSSLEEARAKVVSQCAGSFGKAACNALPKCRQGPVTGNNRAVYCKMNVFMHDYEAFGSTETETRVALKSICSKGENSDFFCKNEKMECRANR